MPYKDKEKKRLYNKKFNETYKRKPVPKEKQQVYVANWKMKDHRRIILNRARTRATQKGIEFNLTLEDIIIPEICPILKIPLFIHVGKSQNDSASLDRINNEKGYVKNNVCVISKRANQMKGDLTLEQVRRLYNYVLETETSKVLHT